MARELAISAPDLHPGLGRFRTPCCISMSRLAMLLRRLVGGALIAMAVQHGQLRSAGTPEATAKFQVASLTVPRQSLPAGCQLAPLVDPRTKRPFATYPGVRQNPWVGTGIEAALVRDFVDGPLLNSDEPQRAKRLKEKLNGLVEAYRAVYLDSNNRKVDVFAVRYDDPGLASKALLSRLGNAPRKIIVIKSTAVVVMSERGGDCAEAVEKYITSLSK